MHNTAGGTQHIAEQAESTKGWLVDRVHHRFVNALVRKKQRIGICQQDMRPKVL
jgi:hypothetical protein